MAKVYKMNSKQWAAYHRLRISILLWLKFKYKIYWITLTSCDETKDMRKSFNKLLDRIETKYGMRPEYMRVTTSEGVKGVYHCFFAMGGLGMPKCQKWLSEQWQELTGAWNVWIRRIGKTNEDATKVSMYAVMQYSVRQGTSFIRADWSRSKVIPFLVSDFLREVRKHIRSECFTFQPWKASYKIVNDAALLLATRGLAEVAGYTFIFSEFTGWRVEVFDRPNFSREISYLKPISG